MISKLNPSFLSFSLKKMKKNLVEDALLDNQAQSSIPLRPPRLCETFLIFISHKGANS